MFNISGSEIVIILLLALIVLGPEKLPEAIRRFGRVYGELRRMSQGFQSEVRSAFEEPIRELRETADLTKKAVMDPIRDEGRATDQTSQRPTERDEQAPTSAPETSGDEADPA